MVPVLMTPICCRCWQNGELLSSHGDYPDVIRTLAVQRNVPLIDLYAESTALLRCLGEAESRKLYLHTEPGVYSAYPDGSRDDTHTQRLGAETFAGMAARGLRELGLA